MSKKRLTSEELKWDWFKTKFPDAELWNAPVLKEMGIL